MLYRRNIWGPNKQPGIIDVIAGRYVISHRFHAILRSSPPAEARDEGALTAAQVEALAANRLTRIDIELANGTPEKPPITHVEDPEDANHYDIAEHLINYQSLDLGEKCIPSDAEYHCHAC